jgi:hypothetical protein
MPWSTPSFEEIKMDAEARGYAGWPENPPGLTEEERTLVAAAVPGSPAGDCAADRG